MVFGSLVAKDTSPTLRTNPQESIERFNLVSPGLVLENNHHIQGMHEWENNSFFAIFALSYMQTPFLKDHKNHRNYIN